jgi:arginine-tRNA-protein transferase
VTLEPSTYSEEKYTLYPLYQRQIHHDPHNTPEDFKRFLVKSHFIVRFYAITNPVISIDTSLLEE